jgi:hypothetical protein
VPIGVADIDFMGFSAREYVIRQSSTAAQGAPAVVHSTVSWAAHDVDRPGTSEFEHEAVSMVAE